MNEMKKFDVLEMKMVIDSKKKKYISEPTFFLDELGIIYSS